METSDYGISGATQVDPANPATRNPHTHHISMTNMTISYDTSVCPANTPPTTGTTRGHRSGHHFGKWREPGEL